MLRLIGKWLHRALTPLEWRVVRQGNAWLVEADWGGGWRPWGEYPTLIDASAAGRALMSASTA